MDIPFSVSSQGEFKVIVFQTASLMNSGDLERLGVALEQVAGEQANGQLILDFSKVEALASQAIGIIVNLHKQVSSVAGGKLVLCGVSPQLTQLLKITRLDRLLKVVKTQKDAMS
jgi:anti-anti-sigma factor